jgi:MATE family multidrug resistance protein
MIFLAILVGRMGDQMMAVHQVLWLLTFKVMLMSSAIATATSIRVAHRVGEGRDRDARRTGLRGTAIGVGFGAVFAIAAFAFARPIAEVFLPGDPATQAMCASLIVVAVLALPFACGAQIAGAALRGIGDTRSALYAVVISRWGIGIPLALYLAVDRDLALRGLWYGLSAGHAAGFVLLFARFGVRMRRTIAMLDSSWGAGR